MRIVARLYIDGRLAGYRLFDEQTQQNGDFTRKETWEYAKRNLITDVRATGTDTNLVISGINGFELKQLPQIKWDRATMKNIAEQKHKSSSHFTVVNTLYDASKKSTIRNILGYKIRYTGNQPFEITRVQLDGTQHTETLNNGAEICINRAELALLGQHPEVNYKLANGRMTDASYKDKTDLFRRVFFEFNRGSNGELISATDDRVCKPVQDAVDASTLETYFVSPVQNKTQNNQSSIDKAKTDGIFGMFKR
jgi:hypothetical protein